MKQIGFFTESDRLSRLSTMGDPLEGISSVVDFDMFIPILRKTVQKEPSPLGGRPAWDSLLMFKILLLQQWYNMADDKTEYLINDRLSFQRFLGLSLGDKVPDAKTIWLFRENLKKSGVYNELFALFTGQMQAKGVITRNGSIVDASFVDAPKQRSTREENRQIKSGISLDLWSDNPPKCRQKDKDARWTKKNGETHYGYKDHIKVDCDSKMIVNYTVTPASVHDSKEMAKLIDKADRKLYADSAYVGEILHAAILKQNPGLILKIHEKGYRANPLTEKQKMSNREKSRVRARVEHVFGHMTNSFGGISVRTIGIARARCQIALKNLAYNLQRYECLVRLRRVPMPYHG
ncbi:MAG: IS5 family transposase [Dehalococcoidia bacterium]|nr:IS5 family transposase [Dehalococcoidia bacterium]